jgi:uncharacterized protein (TIGR03435 family)
MRTKILIGLIAIGLANAQSNPEIVFEAASVKRSRPDGPGTSMFYSPGGRLTATSATLKQLVLLAYGVSERHNSGAPAQNATIISTLTSDQITGGPGWVESEQFNVTAKADGNARVERMSQMLQALLADRFQLKVHRETRQLPVYVLLTAKNGARMPELKEGSCFVPGSDKPPEAVKSGQRPTPCGGFFFERDRLDAGRVYMQQLAGALSNQLRRLVVDKTGLTGTYDVHLRWTPDESPGDTDSADPSLFTAVEEQLGLKLESQKGLVETVVIDHAEKPSEN